MDNFLFYLLKVSAGTTLFYLCYLMFFRKDTFYLRNRIFLILTLLIPSIIPIISYTIITVGAEPAYIAGKVEDLIYPMSTGINTVTGSGIAQPTGYYRIAGLIYIIIAALMVIRCSVSLIRTFGIIRKGVLQPGKFPQIVISDLDIPPFSFFPYAVIPAEEMKRGNYAEILDHEFAHLRQGHTFDMLLSELFIAFQWFNPVVWLIKRSVILNHEYLADKVSIKHNPDIREYQYRLLNFRSGLKNISMAHNFSSLIKNRIIMINKKPTPKKATIKNFIIIPVLAIVAYAFATPEYKYVAPAGETAGVVTNELLQQSGVKGVVLKADGKPLAEVEITVTGAIGNATGATTSSDGRFSFNYVQPDGSLVFTCRGYKRLILKPVFGSEMTVRMETDPDYKAPAATAAPQAGALPRAPQIVVIDGVISTNNYADARRNLGYDMGTVKILAAKEATEKYGEKGINGAYEIITRKKAIEMGLKPAFPRLAPEDYPTFQNLPYNRYNEWIVTQLKYPAEARTKNLEGYVTVNFRVELDGSVANITASPGTDPVLANEVIRVLNSSPAWDKPKNTSVDEPFSTSVTIRFSLPDKISKDSPYVIVEQMPQYPGGDEEMMKFIFANIKYPEEAKRDKIEGRVFIRFVVNTNGKVDGVSVLKGVHPLLDAEAVRVVGLMSGWQPGKQGGEAVSVWFQMPVTFSLANTEVVK